MSAKTMRGDRLHIGVFGRRNAGKSSLINALTGQPVAIVSDVPGTTTDPVYKALELQPLGAVVLSTRPASTTAMRAWVPSVKKSDRRPGKKRHGPAGDRCWCR